jgi:membrane protein
MSPYRLPPREWLRALRDVAVELKKDHISIVSAALAFYGVLAIFPGLIAIVSIYGLFLDPAQIEEQVAPIVRVMPGSAAQLVTGQLHDLVEAGGSGLGLSLLLSAIGVLWSASSGINALFKGVNLAYFEEETRSTLKLRAIAFVATLGMLLFSVIALATVAVLPPLFSWVGAPPFIETAIAIARWPVLAALLIVGLALLYRFAPNHEKKPPFRWVTPGSIAATALWLLGSIAFSAYVSEFGRYNETYGALGAVIVLLLWLWLSAFAVLLGAELNAVLEHRAGVDRKGPTSSEDGAGDMLPSGRRWAPPAIGS